MLSPNGVLESLPNSNIALYYPHLSKVSNVLFDNSLEVPLTLLNSRPKMKTLSRPSKLSLKILHMS